MSAMKTRLKATADVATVATPCAVVFIGTDGKLSAAATVLDRAGKGCLKRLIRSGECSGKPGKTLLLHQPPGLKAARLLVVGCGEAPRSALAVRKVLTAMIAALEPLPDGGALICLDGLVSGAVGEFALLRQLTYLAGLSRPAPGTAATVRKLRVRHLDLVLPGRNSAARRAVLAAGTAMALGADTARELGNLPPNKCTPRYLARRARQLARGYQSLSVRVLGEAEQRRLGMGALLSVSQGSREPSQVVVLRYSGAAAKQPPVALVGKGVTFDSGGISIKPAQAMDEMKYDMCGAAAVFGVLHAAAELELPLNLVGVVPSSENLPGGGATRPGDVVTSMSGKTIEVLNTDAEGRLLLCDALHYTQQIFHPACLIDIATLTGACVVALGKHASGLLSNRDDLADALLAAGEETGDRAWRLPLWDEYQEELVSNFADLPNIGGRGAGTITAACFLSRFVDADIPWAHLDIAGVAYRGGAGRAKGATGRPVPLLVQYLIERCRSR